MVLAIVDGTMRLIERVIKGGRKEDSVADAMEDIAWDEAHAGDIDEGLRSVRIKMLSVDESRKAIDALEKRWDIS